MTIIDLLVVVFAGIVDKKIETSSLFNNSHVYGYEGSGHDFRRYGLFKRLL